VFAFLVAARFAAPIVSLPRTNSPETAGEFWLGKDKLSFWSPQTRAWGVEPGTFEVWAGEDSIASLHAEIVVTE
jgi:Fibronectin type III-like domain